MIEVEIRAECEHAAVRSLLSRLGAVKTKSSHEHDEYYKFGLDAERRLLVRVRRTDGVAFLTFKGSSKLSDDIAWEEWETQIEQADALEHVFLANGLVRVVTIDKIRESYSIDSLQVNLDRVERLGDFVEVEALDEDAAAGHARVVAFLRKLGIDEAAFVKKGYVPLLLEHLEAETKR